SDTLTIGGELTPNWQWGNTLYGGVGLTNWTYEEARDFALDPLLALNVPLTRHIPVGVPAAPPAGDSVFGMITRRVPHVKKPPIETPLNWEGIPHADKLIGLWVPRNQTFVPNLADPGNGDMFPSEEDLPLINVARNKGGQTEGLVGENTVAEGRHWVGTWNHGIGTKNFTSVSRIAPIETNAGWAGWFSFSSAVQFAWAIVGAWGIYASGGRKASTTLDVDTTWYTLGMSRPGTAVATKFYLDGVPDGGDAVGTDITVTDV
ncbi:unnamed protein product, partial [marine sediment metagenome]